MSELRDKLEEAFDGDSTVREGSGSVSEDTSAPEGDAGDDAETEKPATETVVESVDDESSGRDESAGEESTEETVTESVEDAKEEVAAKEELAAPYGWKPAMREKYWKELPAEVQSEIIRREVDISKGMEMSAAARKLEQEFTAKTAPYMAEFASRGVQPMDAFDNYLKTAYNLRHAQPQDKAAIVAGIIEQYGVDVGALDGILTKQIEAAPGNTPDQGVLQAINQAMAPVNQFMTQYQQAQTTQAETNQQGIQDEIKAFQAKPENEFYRKSVV